MGTGNDVCASVFALADRLDPSALSLRELRRQLRLGLEQARRAASAAYSAGDLENAALVYDAISRAYLHLGLAEETITFARRAAEVRERAAKAGR